VSTLIRRNISRNDKARTFNLSAAENTTVEDNAIYIGPGLDVQMLLVSNWSGWPDRAVFRRNTIYAEGVARYGHETGRSKDGTYTMSPGWGPAKGITFEENRFYGKHVDRPEDAKALVDAAVKIPKADWKGPEFDPARPGDFDKFLRDHRRWMVRLMEVHFGTVKLGR
jgi:hypothetical protein